MIIKFKQTANNPSIIFPITNSSELITALHIHGKVVIPKLDSNDEVILDNDGNPTTEEVISATVIMTYYETPNEEIVKTIRTTFPLAMWNVVTGVNADGTPIIDETILSGICSQKGYTFLNLI